jgi:HlyD family secretion protein
VEGGIIQVAARRAGVINEVLAQEGDMVRKARCWPAWRTTSRAWPPTAPRPRCARPTRPWPCCRCKLSASQRELRRLESLAPNNFVAAQKLDQARDAVREAEARIMAQQAGVATAQAPFNEAKYDQELLGHPRPGRRPHRAPLRQPGAGASTLNVSNMFDLEPQSGRIVRAEIAEGSLSSSTSARPCRCRRRATRPRSMPARCCAAPPCSAPASCSRRSHRRRPTTASSRWCGLTGAPFLIGQRVLVKFVRTQQAAASAPAELTKSRVGGALAKIRGTTSPRSMS